MEDTEGELEDGSWERGELEVGREVGRWEEGGCMRKGGWKRYIGGMLGKGIYEGKREGASWIMYEEGE